MHVKKKLQTLFERADLDTQCTEVGILDLGKILPLLQNSSRSIRSSRPFSKLGNSSYLERIRQSELDKLSANNLLVSDKNYMLIYTSTKYAIFARQ